MTIAMGLLRSYFKIGAQTILRADRTGAVLN